MDSESGSAGQTAALPAGTIARGGASGTIVQSKALGPAEELLSWRSGFLAFRETPLADAAAEFNRYNTRKIVIADPRVAAIHIGGDFRATNVEAFVRLLEESFAVHADRRDDRVLLSKP
jgi:transmembrane sensor